jgi:hypothetical protein
MIVQQKFEQNVDGKNQRITAGEYADASSRSGGALLSARSAHKSAAVFPFVR